MSRAGPRRSAIAPAPRACADTASQCPVRQRQASLAHRCWRCRFFPTPQPTIIRDDGMRSFRREAVPRVGPERRGGRARTASCGNSLRRVSLAARRVSGLLCSTLLVITLRVALRGNMAWPVRQAAAGLAKTPPCRKAGGAGNFVCRRRRRQRRWCRPAPYCAGRCCKAPAGATGALAGPWAWWWAMATPALSTPSRAGTGAWCKWAAWG